MENDKERCDFFLEGWMSIGRFFRGMSNGWLIIFLSAFFFFFFFFGFFFFWLVVWCFWVLCGGVLVCECGVCEVIVRGWRMIYRLWGLKRMLNIKLC